MELTFCKRWFTKKFLIKTLMKKQGKNSNNTTGREQIKQSSPVRLELDFTVDSY